MSASMSMPFSLVPASTGFADPEHTSGRLLPPSISAMFLFFCLTILAVMPAIAAAADPAGRVLVKLGSVQAVGADGTSRTLKRRDSVFQGDTITTGARGRVQIRFTDGGLMSIRPETEMAISEYQFKNNASDRNAIQLKRGGFRTVTGRIARNNRRNYRVRTPLATIGVRGTDWQVNQRPGGETVMGVAAGGIEADTISGENAELGDDVDYNFAEVNTDGSIDYLLFPPVDFSASPSLDEANEEGGSEGEASEEGGDDAAELAEASGGEGAAPPISGDNQPPSIDIALQDQAEVNPFREGTGTGDGSLVNAQGPSAAELSALQEGNQIGVFTTLPDAISQEFFDLTFALIEEQTEQSSSEFDVSDLLASSNVLRGGLAATSDDGDVVFAYSPDAFGGFSSLFADNTRADNFAQSTYLLDDGGVPILNDQVDAGGISGVRLGVYNPTADNPLRATFAIPDLAQLSDAELMDLENAQIPGFENSDLQAIVTALLGINRTVDIADPVAFGVGPHLQDLTLMSATFQSTAFAATTNADSVSGVNADLTFSINAGNGSISDGILDVEVQVGQTPAVFIVDLAGSINNGILNIFATDAQLFEGNTLADEAIDMLPMNGIFATTDITGFTTGTGANPGVILGFDYEAQSTLLTDPLFAKGSVLLQPGAQPLFQDGFLFVGSGCCFDDPEFMGAADVDLTFGLADDGRLNGGDVLLGINVNEMLDEDLTPLDAGFLDNPPDEIFDNRNATITQVVPRSIITGAEETTLLRWDFDPMDPGQNLNGTTQALIDNSTDSSAVLATYRPTSFAALQSSLSSQSFAVIYGGDSEMDAANPLDFVGVAVDDSGGMITETPILRVSASFMVDPMTNTIRNGSLAVITDEPMGMGGPEDGYYAFFDGGYAQSVDSNNAADLFGTFFDGNFKNTKAIDPNSDFAGAFTGTDGEAFVGFAHLYYQGGMAATEAQALTALTLTRQIDQRILASEVQDFDRLGLMVFNGRDNAGLFDIVQYPDGPAPGLLLGLSTDASTTDPTTQTGAPKLIANDSFISEFDIFQLPGEYVVSQDTAFICDNMSCSINGGPAGPVQDVLGTLLGLTGANAANGFDVSWGLWNANSALQRVFVQDDINNPANGLTLDRDVLFVSIEDMTPSAAIASMSGLFLFDGNSAFIGRGGDNLSPTFSDELNSLSVSMVADFDTGAITGGMLTGEYGFSSGAIGFDAGFSGQLRGSIADLNVDSVTFTPVLSGIPETGLPAQSGITGALVGPNADAFVGGFSIASPTRHAEGLFAIENIGPP